jgi:cellulose synthase/poly-beta-1,6-N-acetylglucosamine synthase-like glycosyltransferase
MIPYIFFTLFAALTAVYMLFLFRMRAGLRFLAARSREETDGVAASLPSVTVLLPVRDEEAVLPHCLASLSAQEYPAAQLEVLVVDDHSSDRSADIVRTRAEEDSRFHLLSCGDEEKGKKAALTRGVSAAQGEIIVTTDADCRHEPQWLRTLLQPFADGADVVAGPVVIDTRARLFARLQAMEFLGLVGVGRDSSASGIRACAMLPILRTVAAVSRPREAMKRTTGYTAATTSFSCTTSCTGRGEGRNS